MVRRAEQAQKAISSLTAGRSKLAGIARALSSVLDEAHERMNMAWAVLNEPYFEGPKHYTYRAQKSAELGICYAAIHGAYDELCRLNVINKVDRTEPTLYELAIIRKGEERAVRTGRRRTTVNA